MTEQTSTIQKDGSRSVVLPVSGRTAVLRVGKGRDMRLAARHVNPSQDPIGYAMALAAQLATIDGAPVLPEDLDEMDMEDVSALMSGLPGKSPLPATSSP
ncbi:hypothetical protein [Neomegalonema sp.]|uniref:hypothetical protein n=1 Tax=Neomegalonema sp. TaxID=2039713 RepID=UPI002633D42E|nr:hypothetical protein [Neomegalonema sp.]MDD2870082.1 hypothetical protein [Neomegalonema sp.]